MLQQAQDLRPFAKRFDHHAVRLLAFIHLTYVLDALNVD
jgi:hypothetical protein